MRKIGFLICMFVVVLWTFPVSGFGERKVLVISPCALKPGESSMDNVTWYADSTAFYFDTTLADTFYAVAPVYLPYKAKVKKFYLVATDNGSDEYIGASLQRHGMISGNLDTVVSASSSGSANDPERRVFYGGYIVGAVVDYNYTYNLKVFFGKPNIKVQFHGVVIIYDE